MAKDKARDDKGRFTKEDGSEEETTIFDPFVGAEDDDLMDMKYIQDESTVVENTHPPETKEEAEIRAAEQEEAKAAAEKDDVQPDEESDEAQVEDEADEEVEAQAEDAEEAEVLDDTDDDPKIPKSRFDEVNEAKKKEKERADRLEKQLEELIEKEKKPKEPEPEPFDYVEKEKEAYDAFLEGDTEKYSAIQEEIRVAQKDELRREAQRIAAEGDQSVKENLTFEETGQQIEADYPALVKDSGNFNEDAYSDLMDLYVGYVNTGRYSRADALQMAADKSVKIHGLRKKAEETLADDADDKVVNINKKKPDLKKKKQIADGQPPVKESGLSRDDEPTVNTASMSDEEFEALPEATKRRLRGDVL